MINDVLDEQAKRWRRKPECLGKKLFSCIKLKLLSIILQVCIHYFSNINIIIRSSPASDHTFFKIIYNYSDIKPTNCKMLERVVFIQFSLQLLCSELLTPTGIN